MLENKIYEGIHYSRFVSSWATEVGIIDYHFKDWLRSLSINGKKIPENVIEEIYELGVNGKLELEVNVKEYIKKLKEEKNPKNT